ncbi:hypothetical protein PsYK624_153970 [Phanerochaete sordida]|uniref:Uncharacterized protein n=1 Tax=Phanerochaete sordida TaxID=48140 RepID=A0A9P3GT43_9APHY|nr:hypothetical protein PsYK624_153970 [Phanerochaete sordida]
MPVPWSVFRQMRKSPPSKAEAVPRHLRLSEEERRAVADHIAAVGADGRRYEYTPEDQDAAFDTLEELRVHVPGFSLRDVNSKLSIQYSTHSSINTTRKNASGDPETVWRWTRIYQCACSINNESGFRPSKKRLVGWKKAGCMCWIRVVSTHESGSVKDSCLLAIDEISGILTHAESCTAESTMDLPPRIPLHPELRDFALDLVRRHIPLTQIQIECRTFSRSRWQDAVDNVNHRYILTSQDSTSLYRSYRRENGMMQRTRPEDNLDKWFRTENPMPPIPALTEALIHYQPHVPGENDRFMLLLSTPQQREMAWKFGHKRQLIMERHLWCMLRTPSSVHPPRHR